MSEPGQEDLAALLADQGVEITASLLCSSAANVDRQRGNGVLDRSIARLLALNVLGRGDTASSLVLHLVDNPQGPLDVDYKRELMQRFGSTRETAQAGDGGKGLKLAESDAAAGHCISFDLWLFIKYFI